MLIAEHHPHRSGRARFEHPAPTLGVDSEALIGLPYAAHRLGHASPDLRPVRALLIRVSLGPRPRSIASATGKPVLFGDFTATMAESDFS